MKRINKTSRYTAFAACLLVLWGNIVHAQQFRYTSPLPAPANTGFYGVELTPELTRYLQTDLHDIRVVDERQQEVPFIIRGNAVPSKSTLPFEPLSITRNETGDSGKSFVEIQNAANASLNRVVLVIKNTVADRSANISGSNDGKKWFTIAEQVPMVSRPSEDKDSYEEELEFPLITYSYLRITIDNGHNAALNIVSALKPVTPAGQPSASLVMNEPAMRFVQKDSSDHNTYLTIYNPEHNHVEQVQLTISGPHFYQRELTIETQGSSINFEVKSGNAALISMPVFNDSVWYVRISNGANPPLKIEQVKTLQSVQQLVVYLEAGKLYKLHMGAANAVMPDYELQHFQDSIPPTVKNLMPGDVTELVADSTKAAQKNTGNKIWLWVSLLVVLIILLFFTVKLVKDMEQKKNGTQ